MSGITVNDSKAMGTGSTGELRVLGGLWLAGAVATAFPAFLLVGLSDHSADRFPGLVLAAITLVGVAIGTWLVASPRMTALPASLGASLVWLVGAAVVYPTQDFTADALWASGVPAVVAVLTGATAWWARQRRGRPS